MTYFEGFIAPVPEANRGAYIKHASDFAKLTPEFGIRRHVEAWDSDVPEGKVTDFRKSVDAREDEKVVLAFFEYPNRQERDAANEKFMSDPRMADMGKDMPFDGKRMIVGGFDAIVEEGSAGGAYTDGFVVPVPETKREDYRALAAKMAKVFRQHGASRVVAEKNQGGEMIASVLRGVDANLPVALVAATKSKAARAEPIALRFETGRAKLAGRFPELEDQMCALTWAGYQGAGSPDRLDAMVWAMTELFEKERGMPRVRML